MKMEMIVMIARWVAISDKLQDRKDPNGGETYSDDL